MILILHKTRRASAGFIHRASNIKKCRTDFVFTFPLPGRIAGQSVLISFIEKEFRLADADIFDIMDRHNVTSKEDLYEAIKAKKISSHPAWEDYIVWKNEEKYVNDLKLRLGRFP